LPPLRFSYCSKASWQTYDQSLDELLWYATPALLQRLTEPLLLLFCVAIVVGLWIQLKYTLLENPPKVLNWVKVWCIGRPIYCVDVVLIKKRSDGAQAVYTCAILHKQLRTPVVRQEAFCQGLHVIFAGVATLFGIMIVLHYDQFAPPRNTPFIQPHTSLHHLRWPPTCSYGFKHLTFPFLPWKTKALLLIATRTLLN
jgi:hypothetical protein